MEHCISKLLISDCENPSLTCENQSLEVVKVFVKLILYGTSPALDKRNKKGYV